ncbi:hypothetical protein Tco_1083734 [Tanacetum coccineum]
MNHVVAMFIPHQITMTLSGLGKEKLFKLRMLSLSKQEKYFRYLSVAKKASLVDKVAMFSAETEDIAAVGCCANILWT